MSIEDPFSQTSNTSQGFILNNGASLNSDPEENELSEKIDKEFNIFTTYLREKKIISTIKFWKENKLKNPILFDLATRLLTIPSTSAEAERFFSVVGKIFSTSTNISDNLLIQKSLLKNLSRDCEPGASLIVSTSIGIKQKLC
ncbi:unnamed protein product, partial [Brachionus calyciflorus]